MIAKRIATRKEAAEFLRVTERTVDMMARDGRLKPFKIGKAGIRFWLADLEAYLPAPASAPDAVTTWSRSIYTSRARLFCALRELAEISRNGLPLFARLGSSKYKCCRV